MLLKSQSTKKEIYEVTYYHDKVELKMQYLMFDEVTNTAKLINDNLLKSKSSFAVIQSDSGGSGGGGTPPEVILCRFYVNWNYQGSCFETKDYIYSTGGYIRYYSNLMNYYFNDCLSSHGEVVGGTVVLNGESRQVNVWKIMLYKHSYYGNPWKYFVDMEEGYISEDVNWDNDYFHNTFPSECINDQVSSIKICYSVY